MGKVLILTILASLPFATLGCHTSTTPQARPNPTATEPAPATNNEQPATNDRPQDNRPLIVCFGDSLTAGYGTDSGQSYPDYLQADLDQLGYNYRVVNQGVSGNTTKDGVERLPEVLALNPAVVVIEFGGNDGLRGLPIADTRTNLDTIFQEIKDSGAKVVLAGITLPPDYGPDYIRQFNDTYTLLAAKYHVPMLPFLLNHVYGVPGLMQRDNTHATARGNQIVAHQHTHPYPASAQEVIPKLHSLSE